MSIDNISQYFDFTNVSNIINVLIVAVSIFYNMKLKVDNIKAQAREDKANEEVSNKDAFINIVSEVMLAQNQTLVEIAMASKLPNESKIRIVNSLQQVNDKVQKSNLDQIYNKAEDVVSDIKDIANSGAEVFKTFTDILGNEKPNQ